MSGDVQPRKRKDKKKKRDDDEPKEKSSAGVHGTSSSGNWCKMGPDDIQLHVHSDHGTGGHWCAKILFFSLMAVLAVLIGLILLENRGISDLDTPLSESRFAEYLEGWVDEKRESHDDHDVLEILNALDDHDHDNEPFAEIEDHDDDEDHDHDNDDDDDEHDAEDEADNVDEEHDDDDDDDTPDDAANEQDNDDDENIPENDRDDDEDNDNESSEIRQKRDVPDVDEDDEEDNDSFEVKRETANVDEDDNEDNESSEDKQENDATEVDDDNNNDNNDDDNNDDDNNDDDNNDDNNDNENEVEQNEHDENDEEAENNSETENDNDINNIDNNEDDDNDNTPFEEHVVKPNTNSNENITQASSVEQLKVQIDELYENFNKLAESLSKSKLEEFSEDVMERKEDDNDDDDDDNASNEEFIDNDKGEDLHLQKLTEKENADKSDENEAEEESSSLKRSGPQYNTDDFENEISRTNDILDDNPSSALKSFENLIKIKPNSPNAWHGKGKALDKLSERQKSNELLNEAILAYVKAFELGSMLDDETFKMYGERCIERIRFIGQHLKAIPIHEALIERFDNEPHFRNQLAVTYLLINRLSDAKLLLHETLLRWRNDGFALVHYGFVLKHLDKNYEAAATFLQEGIDTEAEGTIDGRFYFNLGESLSRLGRNDEAMKVYRKGASKNLFRSEYQRSLYNVDHLKSHPFWTKKQTGYQRFFDVLEQNWEKIRDEGVSVLNDKGQFIDEAENLRDVGDWKQFDLFARGRKVIRHCEKTPFTCKLIETFPAARYCKRGQVKFSVMHPGTHVWPHCGPTNCRIRAHLGLKVPDKTFIRVATETRSWKEGQFLIFDDSFEHEVWHNGTSFRLVLIVDVWHPDLTEEERVTMTAI